MAITKKKTNECKTYDAARIVRAGVNDGNGYVRFIDAKRGVELEFPVTKDEYVHIATGAGTTIDAFEHGLSKAFRYQFLICTEIDPETKKETVTAVHSAPMPSYMICDWSDELDRRIPSGGVLCTFRDNGGIDLNTFPSAFENLAGAVLNKLSAMDTVSSTTTFSIGDIDCKVRNVDGNECMLVMKRKK